MENNVSKFLNRIINSKLTRDKKTQLYTLGDSQLDSTMGLPCERTVYAPNADNVESFANISYLLALMGFKATNFTAVSGGFLLSVENQSGVEMTLFVNKATEEYNRSLLIGLAGELADSENLEYYKKLAERLEDEVPLRNVCLDFSNYKEEVSLSDENKAEIASSILAFSGDWDVKDSINVQNCINNHLILRNVCFRSLGVNEATATEEELRVVQELYDKTLNEWILPGYRAYRGVTMAKYGKILNDRALEVIDRFKDKHDSAAVLNMCSTDYTADVVYAIMSIYENAKDTGKANTEIDKVIPETPNNGADKREIIKLAKEYFESLNQEK